jgi:O-acetyl-ADP-ribose deacetylase (regulator of RNase III)
MTKAFQELLKQPYWVIVLILGVALIAFPSVTIDNDYHWTTHPPSTLLPVCVGIGLLLLSSASFGFTLVSKCGTDAVDAGTGLDLTRVKERDGVLSTTVGGCEILVVDGHIEDYPREPGTAVILPCNEYFDDRCAGDTASALGAYANRVFHGQAADFISLMRSESQKQLGPGTTQQKTAEEQGESFGTGRCVLLIEPLGRSVPIALISTTTQRAREGLSARISFLFDGMQETVKRLADARLTQVAMPILGAGLGHIDPPLALVGLLLAVAEAARYGQGGQRLKKVTIVVFKRDADSPAEADRVVVRRALALIGSRD